MSYSAMTPPLRLRDVTDRMHVRLFTADVVTLAAGKWNTKNVRSAYWRFYQNADDGAFLALPDGGRFPLQAGRIYFVPAGVRFSCGNAAAFRHFYIHFDIAGLPRLTLYSLFDAPIESPSNSVFETSVAAFAAHLPQTTELDFAGQCRAKALIYEGLARYLDNLPVALRQRAQERIVALEPVSLALERIDAALSEPLRLPELARLCCLSPDHFARVFKNCVGMTPGNYITERRAARAAQLLLFTDQSLETIAQTCGFGNRNYFTRRFTQTIGVPPAAYRRSGPI